MAVDESTGTRAKLGVVGMSTLPRLMTGLGLGIVATVALGFSAGWEFAPLVGWDVLALVVVSWTWLRVWPMNPERTREHARREDPARPVTDLLLLTASVASLIGVAFAVVASGNSHGGKEALLVILGVVSVVLSWSVVHTTFALRYALLYYTGPKHGIDFNQPDEPQYSDFAYVAFTLGMTYQVSDTDLQTKAIRATALRQALLSYLFGVVIIAILINVVANLSS
jgi:uncharacterized membrane protein